MMSKLGKATTNEHLLLKRQDVEKKNKDQMQSTLNEAQYREAEIPNLYKVMQQIIYNNDEDSTVLQKGDLGNIEEIVM